MRDKKQEILKFVWIAGYMILAILLFYPLLHPLGFHSINHQYYSYIPFIPFISLGLIFLKRHEIIKAEPSSKRFGYIFISAGLIVATLGYPNYLPFPNNGLAILYSVSAIIFWSGLFISTFGSRSYLRAALPVILLCFSVPLPEAWQKLIIHHMQQGSSAFLSILLQAVNVQFLQDETAFHFSNISINIADVCSGIRSSLSLMVVTVIISGLYLSHWWKRLALLACIYPIMLFKNALRILTVTLLAEYFDPAFITGGFIHKSGGFIFFGTGLILIFLVAHLLRKMPDLQFPHMKRIVAS